jgi:hypothetical protein
MAGIVHAKPCGKQPIFHRLLAGAAFQFFDDLFRPKGFGLQRQRRGPAKAQGNALGIANAINPQSAESAAQPLFGLNNASFPPPPD